KKNLKEKPTAITKVNLDTLRYFDTNFSTNFVFFDQDVIITFFEAPADMTIRAAGFSISDDSAAANGSKVSIRLIKSNWTMNQIRALREDKYLGYYPSEGDGYNNSDYFGENATGEWIDSTDGVYPSMPWMHEDYDLWSDNMNGVSLIPKLQNGAGLYQWVEMSTLGYEHEVLQGAVIGVVLKHEGTGNREDRLGIYSSGTAEVPSWKYYEYGRFDSTSPGWWTSTYTFDMALAVDLYGGPLPPRAFDITELQTTLSEDPREVQAYVYYDSTLIDSVNLLVKTITLTQEIKMENISGVKYSGTIPGFPAGTKVSYFIRIYYRESPTGPSRYNEWHGYTYKIFKPSGALDLFIWDGFTEARARQLFPYYIPNWLRYYGEYDAWHGGDVTLELLEYYPYLCFISRNNSPEGILDFDTLKTWLVNNNGIRDDIIMIGDEIIGQATNWKDTTFTEGSFFYDVLGITDFNNDINYENDGDQWLPSIVFPIELSEIGNSLYFYMKLNNADTLLYNPSSVMGEPNWLDGYSIHKGEPFMKGFSRNGVEHIIGHSVNYGGSRIVFMAFDPLSLESSDGFWYGYSEFYYSLFDQAMTYRLYPSVRREENSIIPEQFSLSQNYPNPFNPSTVIKFQVPSSKFIKLQVYDILGREVQTLANEKLLPGNYTINFDAGGLASGVYLYRLTTVNFSQTKKMILLR
ncbi:MAG: T9SS type A sorting domain-containing protein, partial [Bacteroidota bacterium]